MSLRRTAWMAIVALGTLAWLPARAQTSTSAADLGVTLTANHSNDALKYAEERTFTVTLQNGGPGHAGGVTLTVALPTPEFGTVDLAAVAGCAANPTSTADGGFTCPVADITENTNAVVTFRAALNKPVDAQNHVVIPASCPAAQVGPFTATAAVDPAVTQEQDPTNNSASLTLDVKAWAELSVDLTPVAPAVDPNTAGYTLPVEPGGTVTYNAVVSNAGPCDATGIQISNGTDPDGVTAAGAFNPYLTLTTVNGDANAIFSNAPFPVPDVAAGASSAPVVLVYTAAGSLPEGVNGDYVSLPETVGATAVTDPGDAAEAGSLVTPIHFGKTGSGCSSVGGLDLAALLGVAALGLRRRRRA